MQGKKVLNKMKLFFLDSLNKDGFENLLSLIYKKFKKYKISEQDLNNIKNISIDKDNFNELVSNSYFFNGEDPNKIILDDSLLDSVIEIKGLCIKFFGHYERAFSF